MNRNGSQRTDSEEHLDQKPRARCDPSPTLRDVVPASMGPQSKDCGNAKSALTNLFTRTSFNVATPQSACGACDNCTLAKGYGNSNLCSGA
jgi:hypothetical protein